jgi:hypothetical protein
MIFISRENIDDAKWDTCIEASSDLHYALSWYLDEICPSWEAIVIEQEDKYVACLPIPWRKKLGVKYVYPPFFMQQLGLYTFDKTINVLSVIEKLTSKYNWVEMYFGPLEVPITGDSRTNMVLSLSCSYEELSRAYSLNHIRNLNKVNKKGVVVQESFDVTSAIKLFIADKGEIYSKIKEKHYQAFTAACKVADSKGKLKVLNALNKQGDVICSAVFIHNKNRIVFAFSGNSEKGRKYGALFLLIDEVIRKCQNTPVYLDFEGSENMGVKRFYKGFGAWDEGYTFLKVNNLPFPLNWIKK